MYLWNLATVNTKDRDFHLRDKHRKKDLRFLTQPCLEEALNE